MYCCILSIRTEHISIMLGIDLSDSDSAGHVVSINVCNRSVEFFARSALARAGTSSALE